MEKIYSLRLTGQYGEGFSPKSWADLVGEMKGGFFPTEFKGDFLTFLRMIVERVFCSIAAKIAGVQWGKIIPLSNPWAIVPST